MGIIWSRLARSYVSQESCGMDCIYKSKIFRNIELYVTDAVNTATSYQGTFTSLFSLVTSQTPDHMDYFAAMSHLFNWFSTVTQQLLLILPNHHFSHSANMFHIILSPHQQASIFSIRWNFQPLDSTAVDFFLYIFLCTMFFQSNIASDLYSVATTCKLLLDKYCIFPSGISSHPHTQICMIILVVTICLQSSELCWDLQPLFPQLVLFWHDLLVLYLCSAIVWFCQQEPIVCDHGNRWQWGGGGLGGAGEGVWALSPSSISQLSSCHFCHLEKCSPVSALPQQIHRPGKGRAALSNTWVPFGNSWTECYGRSYHISYLWR